MSAKQWPEAVFPTLSQVDFAESGAKLNTRTKVAFHFLRMTSQNEVCVVLRRRAKKVALCSSFGQVLLGSGLVLVSCSPFPSC